MGLDEVVMNPRPFRERGLHGLPASLNLHPLTERPVETFNPVVVGVGLPDPHLTEKKPKEATSIKVDSDLWKQAKIVAIQHGMELSQIVEDGLRGELARLKKQSEAKS